LTTAQSVGPSPVSTPVDPSSFQEVRVAAAALREIRTHGERSYPEEACGLLIGPIPGAKEVVRSVSEARPVPNRKPEERTHRFLIPAEDFRAAERELEGSDQAIVGFYHSHPDHPARPSAFDQDHAWPWYAYLVLAVERGRADELGAFELDAEQRAFQPRRLTSEGSP
jgi:proteasome lid subunit RPN8/RPN11